MNNDRVKELQDLSNEFLRKLGNEEEDDLNTINHPLKTEINENAKFNPNYRKLNLPDFSISRLYRRKNEKKVSLVKINYIIFNL